MPKVESQISYIPDKEGLEDGIPNYRRLGEGLGLGKDYKTGFLSPPRGHFDRIRARAPIAIGAKQLYSPQLATPNCCRCENAGRGASGSLSLNI